jgi:hypothetical protein
MVSKLIKYPYSNVLDAVCAMFGLVGALLAQQTSEKLVRVNQAAQITDAVMISNVAVGGKTVECGLFVKPPAVVQPVTPFQAGSDWLQQMTISLINRTAKTIVFGAISVSFLDTGDCKSLPCAGASINFGQRPAVDAYDGRTGQPLKPEHPERPPLDWKSEQTLVVHVSDYMAEIEPSLANILPVTAITKVNVNRGAFYFENGMQWASGRFSIPDPEHAGKFQVLPSHYFPGQRDHNWPPGYHQ